MATILSVANSGKNRGLSGKIDDLVNRASQNQLWPNATPFDRAALYRARKKIDWRELEAIAHGAYATAKSLWRNRPSERWCGMSVFAMDGSQYTLPATDALREEFDPGSGLKNAGKGHYPQCLVETAYDVLSGLPVARVVLPCNSSERDAAILLLPYIPLGNVVILDRGYPGYEFIRSLRDNYQGGFVIRCPALGTFKEVVAFIAGNKNEDVVTLLPTQAFLSKHDSQTALEGEPLTVRLVRLKSPDGTLSVLITNMLDTKKYCSAAIKNLYYSRYRIEEYFRHEKCMIEIERFHSKDPNGIRQELIAAVILSIVARLMVNIKTDDNPPQFKNAVISLALEAALLAAASINVAVVHFNKLLDRIARIKYHKPKKPRKSYPRISRGNPNKWIDGRGKVLKCQA